MNTILLAHAEPKEGTYGKGKNKGKKYSIAVCEFAGLNRSVKRIVANLPLAQQLEGTLVDAKLVEAKVERYSFENAEGEKITTDTKWVVQFAGESLATAIKAHGKKPVAQAAPVEIQNTADTAVS